MYDENKALISTLREAGYLRTPSYIDAFNKIRREYFVLPEYAHEAYINYPLEIGFRQTISQPATVAFMIERLKPTKNDKILDIGSGSGWQSALLGHIVGPGGRVVGIELIPELAKFGQENIKRFRMPWVKIINADGSCGYPEEAPYDKIIAAAAVQDEVPRALVDQLKVGGKMLIPLGAKRQSLFLLTKLSDDKFKYKEYKGFVFVPMIKN